MHDINKLRKDIDTIDNDIKELFLRRMQLANDVAKYKMNNNDKIFKPERENELIETLTSNVPNSLKQGLTSVIKSIIRISRKCQYITVLDKDPNKLIFDLKMRNHSPKTVCYQGLPGSYQFAAANKLFFSSKLICLDTFEEVFKSVSNESVDVGIVPIENSTAGTINEVYEHLEKYDLYISISTTCKIKHCLAGIEGVQFDQIKNVYSHPQALNQCKKYIKNNGFVEKNTTNTATAAQFISKNNDKTCAAICSLEAATLYGLTVIQKNINDKEYNQTRFIAISKNLSAENNDNRISILFTIPHVCGSLASTLSIFSDYGINLLEIHSRPEPNTPWTYKFQVDFIGNLLDKNTRSLLYQLTEELPYMKILGCYSVIE